MDRNKAISFIESSTFSHLLSDQEVTDISYNGREVYYFHNYMGRQKSEMLFGTQEAHDFIRQIANLTESAFSFSDPVLDISFGRYRINAVHHAIGRVGDQKVITFSIRIVSSQTRINDEDIPKAVRELFDIIIASRLSIVIAGTTGSGKTELQKYIISKMPPNERIIVIDNVNELTSVCYENDVDSNFWIIDGDTSNQIQMLVRNALRSNPDWIIIAESRGKEMMEILNASLTGHPVVTTIHAIDSSSIINRMSKMIMMNGNNINYENASTDLINAFRFFVFLKRSINKNGLVRRYISSISIGDGFNKPSIIFSSNGNVHKFEKIDKTHYQNLEISEKQTEFYKVFIKGENNG
ncbi:MAG: ATPase, T2SS/T4P/T4SS family [Erysipelotrichaceae bacterium]|nr:ATPase, T2SS/T4P/T4SS family [Erysipelotrichaceae bacterium]